MADDTPHSSWHPALRSHNSSHDVPVATPEPPPAPADNDDADFFDRIPAEHSPSIAEDTAFQGSGEESTSGTVQPSFIQEHKLTAESPAASAPAADESRQDTQTEVPEPVESPTLIPEPTHDLLENTYNPPHDQVHNVDPEPVAEPAQLPSQEPARSAVDEAFGSLDEEESEFPREQYEYQGQTTAADDAVDESDDAPLMQDEEILPTPGFATDAPATNAHDVPFDSVHSDPSAVAAAAEHVYEMSTEDPSSTQSYNIQDPARESHSFDDQHVETSATSLEALEETKQTLRQAAEEPMEEPAQVQPQSSAAFEWGDDDQTEDFGAVVGNVSAEENNVDSDNLAAGSGFVASQATAVAQALQEQKAQDGPAEGEKSEEDLAAMWSAALDDDDFLDDNAVDPSGFFDDDGEGFLDDFDTTSAPTQQVLSPEQALSPGIAPVLDGQGNTVGFTKLGGPQEQINAP
ncbi:hypothetical protein KCU96_g18686, partial [Aureobasidium melanogenum]